MPRIQSESVNEASRFLASTLHEIRTPVQTIMSALELISETNLDKEQTEYIRQIQFSAEVLLDLANNILDFTKIRSAKFRLETIPFDIGKIAEMVVDLISIEAFNKDIEIVTDISPSVPTMLSGDPVRIQQIILNLIKNAVKFTNHGYIHVELDYNKSTGLHFQVTDSGIGISEEKRKKLFTDYFQADVSTYRKFGGTGLGLSISKSLVSVMKGEINVKPNPYGGSIFYFDVPLKPAKGAEPAKPIFSPEDDFRILIVEDNNLQASSLKSKLLNIGFKEIDIASSADEAMTNILFAQKIQRQYKIAFIDMTLPVVDGWHLASNIIDEDNISKIQLYLLIPEGQLKQDAKMKLLDWFDGYLYKPVKREKLFELMDSILSSKYGGHAGEKVEKAEPLEEAEVKTAENPGKGLKVLVAEDHPTNQLLLKTFLTKFETEVLTAADGDEVVECVSKNPDIHIIFMDIYMPNKSGVEATKEIKRNGYKGIIIACTANNDSNDFRDYMKIGMNDILVKPFKSAAIKSMLEKWGGVVRLPDSIPVIAADSGKGEAPLWDKADFDETTGGDEALGKKLFNDYIDQTEELLGEMMRRIEFKEMAELERIGHTFKGSSNTISAFALGKCGLEMEKSAKEQNLDAYMKAAKHFIILFKEFKKIKL
ncbi:MAG: response regulator [Treponema sp.]|nr:response regulator [Treponema sp.]